MSWSQMGTRRSSQSFRTWWDRIDGGQGAGGSEALSFSFAIIP